MVKKLLTLIGLSILLSSTDAVPTDETPQTERSINILLNCGWALTGKSGSQNYEKYFVAAANLAAANDVSLAWLEGQIEKASENASNFAKNEDAARTCLTTLDKAKAQNSLH